MNHTIIEATKCSPRIELNPEGEMLLEGRSILEDTFAFYKPIKDWIKAATCKQLTVEIRLEYMNTSSTKHVLMLLKSITENTNIKNVYVKWFYEEDDEDMLETGKDFESLIRIPFDFYAYVVATA